MNMFKSNEDQAAEAKAEQETKEREAAVAEHNRGQDEGAKADLTDRVLHNTVSHIVHSEDYNKGWDNATRDKWI